MGIHGSELGGRGGVSRGRGFVDSENKRKTQVASRTAQLSPCYLGLGGRICRLPPLPPTSKFYVALNFVVPCCCSVVVFCSVVVVVCCVCVLCV